MRAIFLDCQSVGWPRQIGSLEPFTLDRTLNVLEQADNFSLFYPPPATLR